MAQRTGRIALVVLMAAVLLVAMVRSGDRGDAVVCCILGVCCSAK